MTKYLPMKRALMRVAIAGALVALAAGVGLAEFRGGHRSGVFDFYVLALSWSPSFCEAAAERGNPPREQCGARPFSFVVHGLWPQYERGFPESCNPPPRLDRRIVEEMLDMMPARRLVYNQWDKHGTCSGLDARGYFDAVRKAREQVKIPEPYVEVTRAITVNPDTVEQAFVDANPGLSQRGIAVTCSSRRLSEVRICMTKDMKFRDCADVDRRACRAGNLVMPPVRGGGAAN